MEIRCQCASVAFTCPTPEPLSIHICHCTQCQRQSSSAFGISCMVPRFPLPAFLPSTSSPEAVATTAAVTAASSPSQQPSAAAAPQPPTFLREWTRPTLSGTTMRCYFCARCGSRLVHACDGEARVSVKGGALKNLLTAERLKTASHIWTKHAIVPIPEGAVRWEGEPGE